jgi:hypothetical protein
LFPGEHVQLSVKYQPTDYGNDAATYVITSDDPITPAIHVAVTGNCPPPIITTTGSLDFGVVCPGEVAEQDLDICNTGVSDLEVSSVGFNPPCADFTIVNNPFPATVSHDFCLPVTIRYTPTGVGFHECTLEIVSNDPAHPVITLQVTGTTPATSIDVAPDVAFPTTVIQDVAACASYEPFAVTNTGECPMTVTGFDIVQPGTDYSVAQLPTLPVTLLAGEVLGEGDLQLVFAPYVVMRHSTAEVRVTYVTNFPAIGDTEVITRQLCGEATRTGVRILVTELDVPVPSVAHLYFYRVHYPGTVNETLGVIDLFHDMPMMTIAPNPPCEGFDYHYEWGGVDDPMILEPGTYRVTAKIINRFGLLETKQIQFELSYCDFWHDARIDFQ